MYQESVGSRKTLGDVDIIFHDGIYHLFHLVLPNHDYIAHAVSNDCVRWRRVDNALFIGDPGSWDDSMLWTVHVTENPKRKGGWRMFYTGLSRRDQGQKQRIGLAESDNLYTWQKAPVHWQDRRSQLPYDLPGKPANPAFAFDEQSCFPLQPDSSHYESDVDTARHWVSWRDPFYFNDGHKGWLLCAGRVNHGPLVRRGCVALMEETADNHFAAREPLFHARLYDDIEVPNLFVMGDDFYLIGSIREEAKVRYWRAKSMAGPWVSPSDNVLIGTGNYAGRVSADDKGFLFWSFFSKSSTDRGSKNLLPPPKRLFQKSNGNLALKTYEVFDDLVEEQLDVGRICALIGDPTKAHDEHCVVGDDHLTLSQDSAFEIFLFKHQVTCFRLQAKLSIGDQGQCGLVFRLDPESRDGYYLALDLGHGYAELRAWGTSDSPFGESAISYSVLQEGKWVTEANRPLAISLIMFGSYIEFSVEGEVILSLADQTFQNAGVGFYVDTATIDVLDAKLEALESPIQSDEQLATG